MNWRHLGFLQWSFWVWFWGIFFGGAFALLAKTFESFGISPFFLFGFLLGGLVLVESLAHGGFFTKRALILMLLGTAFGTLGGTGFFFLEKFFFFTQNPWSLVVLFATLGLGFGLISAFGRAGKRSTLLRSSWGISLGGVLGFGYTWYVGEGSISILGLGLWSGALLWGVLLGERLGATYWLRVILPAGESYYQPLFEKEVLLGTSPWAHVTLPQEGFLLPYHAKLLRSGDGRYCLEALQEMAQVEVNYRPLKKEALEPGQLIKLGQKALLQFGTYKKEAK